MVVVPFEKHITAGGGVWVTTLEVTAGHPDMAFLVDASETQAGASCWGPTLGFVQPHGVGQALAGEEGRLRRNALRGGDRGADKRSVGRKGRRQAAKGIGVTGVFSG